MNPDDGTRSILTGVSHNLGRPAFAVIDSETARMFVADRFYDRIHAVDLTTGIPEQHWDIPDTPAQIAYDRVRQRLFIRLYYADEIAVLDVTDGSYTLMF